MHIELLGSLEEHLLGERPKMQEFLGRIAGQGLAAMSVGELTGRFMTAQVDREYRLEGYHFQLTGKHAATAVLSLQRCMASAGKMRLRDARPYRLMKHLCGYFMVNLAWSPKGASCL